MRKDNAEKKGSRKSGCLGHLGLSFLKLENIIS